ncbi:MAG: DUF4215 domain-containing protein, partial [Myxococcota bacterium]
PTCGDTIHQPGEQCDDGDDNDNDACTTMCMAAFCGDGFTWAGVEACDDGNGVDTDACTTACLPATCGDGFTWAGVEQCDDGNNVDDDACTNACTLPTCGDGIVQPPEQCDDGNNVDNDGCSNSCTQSNCGDGIVQPPEECDDANLDQTDGCTSECFFNGSVIWIRQHHNPLDLDAVASGVATGPVTDNIVVVGHEDRSSMGTGLGIWIRKYDPDGNELWTLDTDLSAANDWAVDADMNAADLVVVTGVTDNSALGQGLDTWVRAYDAGGGLQWEVVHDSPASADDVAGDVVFDGSNDVVMVATEQRPDLGTQGDIVVRKFDVFGNEIWTRRYSTPLDEVATGVTTDPAERIYAAGWQSTGPGMANWLLMRWEDVLPGANPTWDLTHAEPAGGFDIARATAADLSSFVNIMGRVDHSDLGQGIDLMGRKYTADGGLLGFVNHDSGLGDDEGRCVAVGSLNSTMLVGDVPDPADPTTRNAYIRRSTDAGTLVWLQGYAGAAGLDDIAYGVDVDGTDHPVVVGTEETPLGLDLWVGRYAQ